MCEWWKGHGLWVGREGLRSVFFFASQNVLVPSPACCFWLSGASCCRTRGLNVFCSVCTCAWLRAYSLCALPGGVQLHQKQCEWQHVLWWAVFRSSPFFFSAENFWRRWAPGTDGLKEGEVGDPRESWPVLSAFLPRLPVYEASKLLLQLHAHPSVVMALSAFCISGFSNIQW